MKPQWENTPENRLKLYKATLEHIRTFGVISGICLVVRCMLMEMYNIDLDGSIKIAYDTDYHETHSEHLPEIASEIKKLMNNRDDGFAFAFGESAPRIEFLESVIAKMESDGIN